jgi:hypothetical protein
VIRRAAIAAAVAALTALLVGGCGGSGRESDELAALVPPNAPVYVESVLRPEGEQRDAIESLSSRIAGIDDPGTAIVQQLDFLLSQAGTETTYEDDIAPWLGERAASFVGSFTSGPEFAAIFESTDTGATEDFLKKAAASSPDPKTGSYKGAQYYWSSSSESGKSAVGVVDDFLVAGTLDAFKAAVDASTGDSLADSSEFQDGIGAVPDDNLALGYVDGARAAEELTGTPTNFLEATALKTAVQTVANGPVTFALSATPDSATVDVSLPSGLPAGLQGGDLVGRSPANAWFAIGVEDLGTIAGNALHAANALQLPSVEDQVRRLTGIDANDAASWMRDGYAFVAGTSETTIQIGGVVSSSDTQASTNVIDQFQERFQQDADAKLGPRPQGADEGFSASAPESPQAIQVGEFGDQVVAALGPGQPAEEALHPEHPLADDPTFKDAEDALGSDFSPLAVVSLSPLFVVAEKGGSGSDPDYLAAKPYLQKLDYLIAGTSGDGDRSTVRFVVGVK